LQGYLNDPSFGWGWYEWARHQVSLKQPNPAHYVIAQFAEKLPKVTVVTQNVDDLHERSGSLEVLHIHGTLNEVCCVHCNHKDTLSQDRIAVEIEAPKSVQPDDCPCCGSIMRPNVVWFGEPLPQDIWMSAKEACEECDLMLIIGTSGLIYPAASLADRAIHKKIESVQINPDATDIDTLVTHNFRGKAGEILTKLFEAAFGEMK
jgi:NAD-dependent deacetylase